MSQNINHALFEQQDQETLALGKLEFWPHEQGNPEKVNGPSSASGVNNAGDRAPPVHVAGPPWVGGREDSVLNFNRSFVTVTTTLYIHTAFCIACVEIPRTQAI